MAKKVKEVPDAELALYEKLVATNPEVKLKGAKSAYTSRNGHMFSYMSKEGVLCLRLPKDEREAFLKKYKMQQPVSYGAVMKEYVEVPATMLKRTAQLKKFFQMSYDYIGSLKPKPTTRKKKTTRKKATKKKR